MLQQVLELDLLDAAVFQTSARLIARLLLELGKVVFSVGADEETSVGTGRVMKTSSSGRASQKDTSQLSSRGCASTMIRYAHEHQRLRVIPKTTLRFDHSVALHVPELRKMGSIHR